SLGCDVAEPAVVILVEVVAAEVVRYVEVGPAVAVVVAPGRREAVAIVVLIQTGGCGNVLEVTIAFRGQTVSKEKVGWTVLRIVIRNGIAMLVLAQIVNIGAEVEIESAVAIIIGGRHSGEGALGRRGEAKGILLVTERAVALIEEQQRRDAGGE